MIDLIWFESEDQLELGSNVHKHTSIRLGVQYYILTSIFYIIFMQLFT